MSNKTGLLLLTAMLLGTILGILGGIYSPDFMRQIDFIGIIFLNAMKLIAVPLVMVSLVVAVASLDDFRKLGRTTGKTLLYFFTVSGVAALLGIILADIIKPGVLPNLPPQSTDTGIGDLIATLVPPNLFQAVMTGRTLGLIFIAVVLGGALSTLGAAGKPVVDFFSALLKALRKLLYFLVFAAPIGVLVLVGGTVAQNPDPMKLAPSLGLFALVVVIGLAIHGLIILPLIMAGFGRQNPLQYALKIGQALWGTFITGSSLPNLHVAVDSPLDKSRGGLRPAATSLPRGAALNMDGTVLFLGAAVIFVAQLYGINLTIAQQVVVLLTAMFTSVAAAGIPHAGVILMVLVMAPVGVPIEGIGIIWVIDWLLDRCRSSVNVWSDAVGSVIIAGATEIKTPARLPVRASAEPARPADTRPARPDRPVRTERYESRPRGDRNQPYQKRPRKQEGRRPGYERGRRSEPRPEPREKVRKEPSPISKDTIERDLERLRKQLTPPPAPATTSPDTQPAITEPKKDEFFEKGIPKFDFFSGEEKADKSVREPSPEPVEEKPAVAPETPAPVEPPHPKETPPAEPKQEETEDAWGRIKKKHPGK
jgi:solute carrier family 1 (neuronal/epithelial high affinity glutamate transporter), member 1